MATLIITLLFGLLIALFAPQNSEPIVLTFLNYRLPEMPTYIVVVVALLVGLLFSWIISLINNVATGFTIRGKESKIKNSKKENTDLVKRVHQLELENAHLVEKTKSSPDDRSL